MRIGKPRRRRVWDDPPESRRAWKRHKRADLAAGKFTRHVSGHEQRKQERRAGRKAAQVKAQKGGDDG
jgi:hypothetical protein